MSSGNRFLYKHRQWANIQRSLRSQSLRLFRIWRIGYYRRAIAFFLAMLAFFIYLTTPIEQPPTYGLDHEFQLESNEFLSTIVGATGVNFSQSNRVEILNNGDQFFPAMIEAINQAERSVTIEAYIYWKGYIGMQFALALAARARSGVKVKILLDAVGSSTIGKEILDTLEAGSCEVAWFNPIKWYTLNRVNNRTHRKSLVIDGRIAFTGGAGFADQWMGNAEGPEHWRDIQIKIEGPGVIPLQTGFARNWLETTGELISGSDYYTPGESAGDLVMQTILSSPEIGSSTVRIMYYLSIVCARRSIYIANPYFVPDEEAINILVEARRRGVDVKIMVSGIHNDNRLARWNSVRLYGRLLEAGIEIYEYNRTMLHHKTMVIDGQWSTIGTTNFDSRSFALSEESNVCIYSRSFAEELQNQFIADLAACNKVELQNWKERGFRKKVGEFFAALLRNQV
jgi:cardiolipin synthase A/B